MRSFILIFMLAIAAHAQPLAGPFEVVNTPETTALTNLCVGARNGSVADLFWQKSDSIFHAAASCASGNLLTECNPFPGLHRGWTHQLLGALESDTLWAALVYEDTVTMCRTSLCIGSDMPIGLNNVDVGYHFLSGPGSRSENNYAFACEALATGEITVACQYQWAYAGPPYEAGFGVFLYVMTDSSWQQIHCYGYGNPPTAGVSTGIVMQTSDSVLVLASSPWHMNVLGFLGLSEPWPDISQIAQLYCGGTILTTLLTQTGRVFVLESRQLLEITGLQSYQALMQLDSDPLAACSNPDFGMAWLSRFGHGLVLNRVDTSANVVYPAGVVRWPEADREIVDAALDITDDGLLVAFWSERASSSPTASHLLMASVGWDTYLSARDRDFIPHPSAFILSAYPNPFNSALKITYTLPRAGNVEMSVFNVLGQKVETLLDARVESGTHAVTWNPRCAGGVYFVTLRTETATRTTKVLYIR